MSRSLTSAARGALLLLATVAFAVPLSSGLWDPAALRVADEPQGRDLTDKSMEAGKADAPFRAEQRDFQGRLLWKLEGERVEGAGGSLLHVVGSPRLLLRQDALIFELSAKLAEIRLPKQGGAVAASLVRVELTGEVSLRVRSTLADAGQQPETSLYTDGLTLLIERDPERRKQPGGTQLRGRHPIRLHAQGVEGGPWELEAATLEGTLAPPRLVLGGPVEFHSGPLASLGGAPLDGVAEAGVELRGEAEEGATAPITFEIISRRVHARTRGDDPSVLVAERLTLGLARAAAEASRSPGSYTLRRVDGVVVRARSGVATAAQGAWLEARALKAQRGGAPPTATVVAEGDVKFGRAGSPSARAWKGGAEALTATFELGEADAALDLSRLLKLHLEGGREVASLSQAEGSHIRLQTLDYVATGSRGDLRLGRFDATLEGVEGGRSAAPWELRADSARARLDRAALASLTMGEELDWRAVLRQAELVGGVTARRRAEALDQRRSVRGERVTWSEDGGMRIRGGHGEPTVEVSLGRSTLRAAAIDYAPGSDRLEASGGLTFVSDLRAKASSPRARAGAASARLEVVADHGWAILSDDPEAWRRQQRARRAAKREAKRRGEPRRRLLPAPLDAVTLVGGEGRVRLRGPEGLRAEADLLTYSRSAGELILSARGGAAPVRAESAEGSMTCRRLRLVSFAPAGPLGPRSVWLSASGGVSARGQPTRRKGTPTKLGLDCEWLACEIAEGERAQASTLRRAFAGGEHGVMLTMTPSEGAGASARRLSLVARSLEAEGDQPLGGGALGVRLRLPGDWRAELALPRRGPARVRGGRLDAVLDLEALGEGAGSPGETREASFRRLIHSLNASEGIELVAKGLRATAERARLDGERGVYVLEGDPAVVTRDGLSQEARVQILELSQE